MNNPVPMNDRAKILGLDFGRFNPPDQVAVRITYQLLKSVDPNAKPRHTPALVLTRKQAEDLIANLRAALDLQPPPAGTTPTTTQ